MAPPLRAPILFADGGALPAASEQALGGCSPTGAKEAGGAQVIRVGDAAEAEGYKTTDVEGADHAALAAGDRPAADRRGGQAVARRSWSPPTSSPSTRCPPPAGRRSPGDPVLWVTRDAIPAATRGGDQGAQAAADLRARAGVGDLGRRASTSSTSSATRGGSSGARPGDQRDRVRALLRRRLRLERRRPGPRARVRATRSGRRTPPPRRRCRRIGHLRAAAAAHDAANALPEPLQDYLLDIQPGYDEDPVRGVYNHGWIIGDESAIAADVQARIDTLLEIQPVDTAGADVD